VEEQVDIDHLLESVDVALEAFAVCNVGRGRGLACPPCDQILVHFVMAGTGTVDWIGGAISLKPGVIVIVPPGLAKQVSGSGPIEEVVEASDACPWVDGIVRFSQADGDDSMLIVCAKLRTPPRGAVSILERLDAPIAEDASDGMTQGLFEGIAKELAAPRIGMKAIVGTLMKQILLLVLRSNLERQDASSALDQVLGDTRLSAAVRAVASFPHERHTLSSLSETAGMSRSRFSHHFARVYGCTPMKYVQSARLAAAATMLRTSRLPVKSVASDVGYQSRSQFCRAFREQYGVGPTTYRTQLVSRSSQAHSAQRN
jgi:AraC family transcriptional regulator, activator of mtrCDE